MQSMTGFATSKATITLAQGREMMLDLEIKSVNSRFFELTSKLPSIFSSLEQLVYVLARKKLGRGKVFLNIKPVGQDVGAEQVRLNEPLLQTYLTIMKRIEKEHKVDVSSQQNLIDFLSLPKLVSFDVEEITDDAKSAFILAVEKLVDLLAFDRKREGGATAKDMLSCANRIDEYLKKVKDRSVQIIDESKAALAEHLKKLEQVKDNQLVLDQEQMRYAELARAVDKNDINEETMRASMHLQSIIKMLSSDDFEIGRKLDFTLQELLREVNTTTSKISDFLINNACIEIKVEIEKIKEQSQNIV